MTWEKDLPYFDTNETQCKGSGVVKLDPNFAVHMPYLRHTWGGPLMLNSCCRSPEHNDAVGGHPRSLHLTDNPSHPSQGAMACDVRWASWPQKKQLRFARLAWSLGWSVGLHHSFCHVDRRADIGLDQAVFYYGAWHGGFTHHDVMS